MSTETNGYNVTICPLAGNGVMNGNSCSGHDEQFEEVEIPVPWGHISGKWWGRKDQQPIVALHGWQDNAGSFDRLAPLLVEGGHSVLAVDLPGHGLSSHYSPGSYYYIFWDGVHVLRRIVRHYGWEKVSLLGHSLGGAISFLYAACYPDEVVRYASIDIPSPPVRRDKTLSILGGSVDKFLDYETIGDDKEPSYTYAEAFEIARRAYEGSANEESCSVLLRRGLRRSKDGGYCFTRDLRLKVCALAFFTLDQIFDMARMIRCEVLNVRGDPGMAFDKDRYKAILDEIEKSAGRVERHVVPGPHHLHMDNAEDVAGIVNRFFRPS